MENNKLNWTLLVNTSRQFYSRKIANKYDISDQKVSKVIKLFAAEKSIPKIEKN